jgi:hypothetical protein
MVNHIGSGTDIAAVNLTVVSNVVPTENVLIAHHYLFPLLEYRL